MIDPADLRDVFDRAASLPPQERASFLARACAANDPLRREVERLLAADARIGPAFDTEPGSDPASAGAHALSLNPGTRLGPYQVLAALGAGGMGEVYRARDTRLDRTVAIKVLAGDLTADPNARERFDREARAIAALSHPHICALHDIGHQDGIDFLVMEFLDGETLAARLRRGRLPLTEALTVAAHVADALAAAHRVGIVHRDLKPGNIMLTSSGVKLLDFGLAKRRQPPIATDVTTLTAEPLTHTGMILGTVQYMAPEQLEGGAADERTDIFAFGVVLYEMLTGRPAFEGASNAALIGSILHAQPAPPSSIERLTPRSLDDLVQRCLAKDPEKRWQSVDEAQRRLIAARDLVKPQRRRLRSVATAAVTAAILLIVAAVVIKWRAAGSLMSGAQPDSASPVARNLTRLTFGEGLETDPTFSPDGRFIAYASDRRGNFDIWVQQLSGGEPVQITKAAAADVQPSWSPDGSTIAFRSERDGGGLYVVPTLGGLERKLADHGVNPSWSSDGKTVRFHTEGLALWNHPAGLFEAPLDNGPVRQLQPGFTALGDWSWIAAHPDGRVSFLGYHRKHGFGFFTVSHDGAVTDSHVLDDLPDALFEMRWNRRQRFQWNPNGTELLLETDANGALQNLWRVRVDRVTLHWSSINRLTTGTNSDVSAAFSPDASRVIFSNQRATVRLWQFGFDTRRRRFRDGEPLTEESSHYMGSDVSPDGRVASYWAGSRGQSFVNVWIMPLNTRKAALVAPDAFAPVWSADSRRLVYVKFRGDFVGGKQSGQPVRAMALRELTGNDRLISPWSTAFFEAMDWMPDGRSLLVADSGQFVIWPVSNPAATSPSGVALRRDGIALEGARISPNRRWLAFVIRRANRPGSSEIGITTIEGAPDRTWTLIAPTHSWVEVPRWAPDGKTLYFLSRGFGRFLNLWGIAVKPDLGTPVGEPFQVTDFGSEDFRATPFGLNVFEQKAFLTIHTATGGIWMLDNVNR